MPASRAQTLVRACTREARHSTATRRLSARHQNCPRLHGGISWQVRAAVPTPDGVWRQTVADDFSGGRSRADFPLPKSAWQHSAWWANGGGHSQARAWLSAGWRTSEVSLAAQTLVFERGSAALAPAKRDRGARRWAPIPSERGAASDMSHAVPAADTAEALTLGGQTFRFVARISLEAGRDAGQLHLDIICRSPPQLLRRRHQNGLQIGRPALAKAKSAPKTAFR